MSFLKRIKIEATFGAGITGGWESSWNLLFARTGVESEEAQLLSGETPTASGKMSVCMCLVWKRPSDSSASPLRLNQTRPSRPNQTSAEQHSLSGSLQSEIERSQKQLDWKEIAGVCAADLQLRFEIFRHLQYITSVHN